MNEDDVTPCAVRHHLSQRHLSLGRTLETVFSALRPTEAEARTEQLVIDDMTNVFKAACGGSKKKSENDQLQLHLFGSRATGLNLPGADLDFCITSTLPAAVGSRGKNDGTTLGHLESVITALKAGGADKRFSIMCVIPHARVPIIKCLHKQTMLPADISFAADGIDSSAFLVDKLGMQKAKEGTMQPEELTALATSAEDRLHFCGAPFIKLLKHCMSQWGLGDASTGGLCPFAQSLLIIFYLESPMAASIVKGFLHDHKQQLQSLGDTPDANNTIVSVVTSSLWIGLFKFLATTDFNHVGLNIVAQTQFPKDPQPAMFYIKNPVVADANCAAACRRVQQIQQRWQEVFSAFESTATVVQHEQSAEQLDACLFLDWGARRKKRKSKGKGTNHEADESDGTLQSLVQGRKGQKKVSSLIGPSTVHFPSPPTERQKANVVEKVPPQAKGNIQNEAPLTPTQPKKVIAKALTPSHGWSVESVLLVVASLMGLSLLLSVFALEQ